MSSKHSLVIRGGTIADGLGGEMFEADIGIDGSRIVEVGKISGKGQQEIDARGQVVTPGFIDLHTHYDAQVTWSERLTPSTWNGVTTLMMGNCGIGLAPCRPDQHDMLIDLMAGVEDIPDPVLVEGLPWTWETFPQYLDFLEKRRFDADVATQVPHQALRVYAMGKRGADLETATEADRALMRKLTAEGLRAGALGVSTSRTVNHKTSQGHFEYSLKADEAELSALADGLKDAGTGWMQLIADFGSELESEFQMMRRVTERSGRPMSITLLERDDKPKEWSNVLERIVQARESGVPMSGQICSRAVTIILGFEISENPFMGCPSYAAIADLPFEERMQALRDPAMRARLLAEDVANPKLAVRTRNWNRLFPLGEQPNYEPPPEESVARRALAQGVPPAEFAYDYLLQQGGRALLLRPLSNYTHGNLDTVRTMLDHPATLLGLGDAGAHVGHLCDAGVPTFLLTHWTRDRPAGGLFSLPWAVKRLTSTNARAMGLHDRGIIAPGYKADLNVIDYDKLNLKGPEVLYDLPAGGLRLVQRTQGYKSTILSGVPLHFDGTPTSAALPGRLIRGAKEAPANATYR